MNAYANASVRACVRCVCSADEEPHHTRRDGRRARESPEEESVFEKENDERPVEIMADRHLYQVISFTTRPNSMTSMPPHPIVLLSYVPNSLYPPLPPHRVYTVVFTRAVCSCPTAVLTAAALRHALPTASQPTPCSLQPSKPSASHRY